MLKPILVGGSKKVAAPKKKAGKAKKGDDEEGAEGKAEKKAAKKPKGPARPKNAFQLFTAEHAANVKNREENEGKTAAEIKEVRMSISTHAAKTHIALFLAVQILKEEWEQSSLKI